MDINFYLNRPREFDYSPSEVEILFKDLNDIQNILIYLTDTFFEEKMQVDRHYYFIEPILIKFILHSNNLGILLKGTDLNVNASYSKRIIDVSSIYILFRALIENYLTFFYLFVQPKDKSEVSFRCLIYEISGIARRQAYSAIGDSSIKIKEKERENLEYLANQLLNDPHLQKIDPKIRKDILSNKPAHKPAKIVRWEKLLQQSQLNEDIFQKAWLLYSNHAHSEYISIIQVREYWKNSKEALSTRDLVLFLNLVLASVLIKDVASLFPQINKRFNSLPETQIKVINFLCGIGIKQNEDVHRK